MEQTVFAQRRQKFLNQIEKGIAVLFSAPERMRNGDSHYPYRTDSSFYYLTGLAEPQSIAIFAPGTEHPYRLFVRPRDPEREMWDGKRLGVEGAKAELGPDIAYDINEFENVFRDLLRKAGRVYFPLGQYPEVDQRVMDLVTHYRASQRQGDKLLDGLLSTVPLLGGMRTIKDAQELAVMRKNCQNSARAHCEAMRVTKPGMYEYQVEAKINSAFHEGGAVYLAYPSIVAGGNNACVLHYTANSDVLNDGDLLLIDAGGEMDHYASDITRTFPVNGKFTPAQRKIYDIVLRAQEAAIAEAKVGASYHAMHNKAIEVISAGLLDLGILQGTLESVIEKKDYRRFYPHGCGHWLGLDVHDAGYYFTNENVSVVLEAGQVFTVEPGIYIPRETADVPEEFKGIGVRIEDDVAMTADGPEIMTGDVPKSIDAVEAMCQG